MEKRRRYWTTREGKNMLPEEFEDKHLINTLRMIERQVDNWRDAEIASAYIFLSTVGGEMASYYAEGEIESMFNVEDKIFLRNYVPIYSDLYDEAEKRGLTWASFPRKINLQFSQALLKKAAFFTVY